MEIGDKIKKARESKGLTQKEVALSVNMDQSQYSKIEKGKTDPSSSTLQKIASSLGLTLSELFASDDIFKEESSYDKSLMEKLRLIDMLDEDEKKAVFLIIDGLIDKKKLRDNLQNLLS